MPQNSCRSKIIEVVREDSLTISYCILGVSLISLIQLLIHYPLWLTEKEDAI